ncbi:Angiopoietin-related protein 7 [Stylophora pistillata]|uniref:Angiopoietin-related protein 7 n=1 Tax=Stylophora pistillata TaxID=50429 RepID=A0A2B4RIZ4_STYPI|nr:Angiopoietin-related protein 7 [Stylophora pistillata]
MSRILPYSLRIFLLIALESRSQTLAHPIPLFKASCVELYKAGTTSSGVYSIDPDGLGAFDVYCDQSTAGGGWTVIQRRLHGSVDFNRSWCDYKHGFGSMRGDANNSFDSNRHAEFSTTDKDNRNCTKTFGAWWFPKNSSTCGNSNLNGNYHDDQMNDIRWDSWGEVPKASITKAEMKIKPHCPGK